MQTDFLPEFVFSAANYDTIEMNYPVAKLAGKTFTSDTLDGSDYTVKYVITKSGKLLHYEYEIERLPYGEKAFDENGQEVYYRKTGRIKRRYQYRKTVTLLSNVYGNFVAMFRNGILVSLKACQGLGGGVNDTVRAAAGPELMPLPPPVNPVFRVDRNEILTKIADYKGEFVSEEYGTDHYDCTFCKEGWAAETGKIEFHSLDCPVALARVALGRLPYPPAIQCPLCGTYSRENGVGWDGSFEEYQKFRDLPYRPKRSSIDKRDKSVNGCCEICSTIHHTFSTRYHRNWLVGYGRNARKRKENGRNELPKTDSEIPG